MRAIEIALAIENDADVHDTFVDVCEYYRRIDKLIDDAEPIDKQTLYEFADLVMVAFRKASQWVNS